MDHALLSGERMLRPFQEKKGWLVCAAAHLTCAITQRKVLWWALGKVFSSSCSGQLLLKWPGKHIRDWAGLGFGLVPLFLRADC